LSEWPFFPQYHWTQVPAVAVKEAMGPWFEEWGRPKRIRVDNGAPWATWSDLPPALALWWIGLGIDPIWNHPHCPKENAQVERCNGLVESWGEPGQCADLEAFRERMTWMAQTQREAYPSVGGCSRLAAYPALRQNPREYRGHSEAEGFAIERVRRYLSQGRWPRIVSKIGQITLYGKAYRVGRAYVGEQVWLAFDSQTGEWVVRDREGTEVIRHVAEQITAEKIGALQVSHPRPPSNKKKRHNSVTQAAA
jgi:transposase InsO family protein